MANNNRLPNGTKMFSGILIVVALVTGIAAIIRPISTQMEHMNERMIRIEQRTESKLKDLDNKLQLEISGQKEIAENASKAIQEVVIDINQTLQKEISFVRSALKTDINNLKESIKKTDALAENISPRVSVLEEITKQLKKKHDNQVE